MHIISRKALREFWEKRPDSKHALQTWYTDAKHANWKNPADIKATHQTARFLVNNRVAFNIKGNQNRIVVVVQYKFGNVYIRFVGAHHEYDRIDASTI